MQINVEDKELQAAIKSEVRKYLLAITREEVRNVVDTEAKRILDARLREKLDEFSRTWTGRSMHSEIQTSVNSYLKHVKTDEISKQAMIEIFDGHMPFRDLVIDVIKQVAVDMIPKYLLQALQEVEK